MSLAVLLWHSKWLIYVPCVYGIICRAVDSNLRTSAVLTSGPQGKYHKCPQSGCFLVFKHAMGKKMLTHLEQIHHVDGKKLELGVQSTVCSYCAKIFNTAFALRRHLQNTHEAPMVSFQCSC